MQGFQYRKGELFCENVPVRRLAEEFGTPLYVYSHGHIVGQFRELDGAFKSLPHLVCYAVKANSNLGVLRALANEGAGFDIVSGGELERVVKAGGDASKCIFSGVGKTREEIELALGRGVYCFNIESEPELELINDVASGLRKRAPIAVRVNPGVDPETHRYISTGKHESKFGISISRALDMCERARHMPHVEMRGVQMHIGSQITSTAPFVKAVKKMLPLIEKLREKLEALAFFSIGGGLGIRYHDEKPPTAQQYARAVLPLLRKTGLKILLEPGRFIVGNGGILLTRVLFVKETPAKNFIVADAAMNDLIRPAFYGSWHEILPVAQRKSAKIVADLVGPVCESGDFFAQNRKISRVDAGELLAIFSAGAYGFVMASNYNARPRAAEVLVKGNRYELVRRRESVKELMAGELVPQWLL
jgi:diaminopimelate decarboxylase